MQLQIVLFHFIFLTFIIIFTKFSSYSSRSKNHKTGLTLVSSDRYNLPYTQLRALKKIHKHIERNN